jgi:radical SAM protein with 4Fe4S-binding SPASM domain
MTCTSKSSMFNGMRVVVVTVTDTCNMRCPQCAYRNLIPSIKHDMPVEVFEKILEECDVRGVEVIRLLGLSEPTLHHKFPALLAACSRLTFSKVHILSNGLYLTNHANRELLLENPPDIFEVGIDAATPTAYALIRGGNERVFNSILQGVKEYSRQLRTWRSRGRWAPRYPELHVSFVNHSETASEWEKFRDIWSGIADVVRRRGAHNFSGRAGGLPSQLAPVPPHTAGCGFLRERIYVDVTGTIHACTLDFQNEFVLGTILKGDTLEKAWNSVARCELLETLRTEVNIPDQCKKCSRCSDLE